MEKKKKKKEEEKKKRPGQQVHTYTFNPLSLSLCHTYQSNLLNLSQPTKKKKKITSNPT